MEPYFFIIAGEKSGDLLGARLMDELKKLYPKTSMRGVGGPEMRHREFECMMRMEDFEVMGFSDILKSLPRLKKQFTIIRNEVLKTNPDAVIFIDYPGFNLRMAKTLRKSGYKGKLIQYVCPTVWAWGKERIQRMASTLDLLLTIYPFESELFKESSLKVQYVGNPVKEVVERHHYRDNWIDLFNIRDPQKLIAIFPGSRKSEIALNLPYQLKAAELLKKEQPSLQLAISCAHDKIMPIIHDVMEKHQFALHQDLIFLPKDYSYELMRGCRTAIAKSGTVTLELALHKCPTVVVYKLTLLNRLIAKYLMRLNLPHYCIVNILSQSEVFPELIAGGLTATNVYHRLKALTDQTEEREKCIDGCQTLFKVLKESPASENAAKAIGALFE